jgi:hypothetical protein
MQGQIPGERQKTDAAPGGLPERERQILRAVKDITYGSVEIVIHDGRVVQIEKREKVRLEK